MSMLFKGSNQRFWMLRSRRHRRKDVHKWMKGERSEDNSSLAVLKKKEHRLQWTPNTSVSAVHESKALPVKGETLSHKDSQGTRRRLKGTSGVPAPLWPHSSRPLTSPPQELTAALPRPAGAATVPTRWQEFPWEDGCSVQLAPPFLLSRT